MQPGVSSFGIEEHHQLPALEIGRFHAPALGGFERNIGKCVANHCRRCSCCFLQDIGAEDLLPRRRDHLPRFGERFKQRRIIRARRKLRASATRAAGGGSSVSGASRREATSTRISSTCACFSPFGQQSRRDQPAQRRDHLGRDRNPLAQLQVVDQEFEIDQTAALQLDVEHPARRLVRRHLGPHRQHVLLELRRIVRRVQHLARIASNRARASGGPASTRARLSAMCSQVQASSFW